MKFHLLHIAGGTVISWFAFPTAEARTKWHDRHYDDPDREPWKEARRLPNGERDDHTSDTWVWLEGELTEVDGEKGPQNEQH